MIPATNDIFHPCININNTILKFFYSRSIALPSIIDSDTAIVGREHRNAFFDKPLGHHFYKIFLVEIAGGAMNINKDRFCFRSLDKKTIQPKIVGCFNVDDGVGHIFSSGYTSKATSSYGWTFFIAAITFCNFSREQIVSMRSSTTSSNLPMVPI